MSSNNNKSNEEIAEKIIQNHMLPDVCDSRHLEFEPYRDEIKADILEALTLKDQAHKAEVEAIKDTFICNRVGVHTCRVNAIHIPFRFCGKIKDLLTPLPESDKTEDLSSKK
jgi:hypothetical protein